MRTASHFFVFLFSISFLTLGWWGKSIELIREDANTLHKTTSPRKNNKLQITEHIQSLSTAPKKKKHNVSQKVPSVPSLFFWCVCRRWKKILFHPDWSSSDDFDFEENNPPANAGYCYLHSHKPLETFKKRRNVLIFLFQKNNDNKISDVFDWGELGFRTCHANGSTTVFSQRKMLSWTVRIVFKRRNLANVLLL